MQVFKKKVCETFRNENTSHKDAIQDSNWDNVSIQYLKKKKRSLKAVKGDFHFKKDTWTRIIAQKETNLPTAKEKGKLLTGQNSE